MYIKFPNSNVFLSVFPKCGCNFIRSFIFNSYADYWNSLGINSKWQLPVIKGKQFEKQLNRDYFVLSIIRDPYDRLRSAFVSKIMVPEEKQLLPRVRQFLLSAEVDLESRLSFDQFCQYLVEKPPSMVGDLLSDGHFRPLKLLMVQPRVNLMIVEISKQINVKLQSILEMNAVDIDVRGYLHKSAIVYPKSVNQIDNPGTMNRFQLSAMTSRFKVVPVTNTFKSQYLEKAIAKYYTDDKNLFWV
jgi:hypothetical protein